MSLPATRIVIIGGGIGGLTLALLLRRRGVVAEVLEQVPELREVGAGVGLSANATRVLQHLDLGDGLAQLSTEPTELIHRDGRDGHRIAAHPVGGWYRRTFGAPWCGMHRIALQQLLGGAWGSEHLHLGCQVVTLEERDDSIRVRCASGATFDADLVVGADGVHSQVRRWITGGDEPIYSQHRDSAAWSRSGGCRSCPIRAPSISGWDPVRTCCTIQSRAAA
jgi:salicylate hydroxylase